MYTYINTYIHICVCVCTHKCILTFALQITKSCDCDLLKLRPYWVAKIAVGQYGSVKPAMRFQIGFLRIFD